MLSSSLFALIQCAILFSAVSGQCASGVRERREIRSLSSAEWETYANAVLQLHRGSSPTRYDQFVDIHVSAQRTAHGTAQFFPWHRAYLYEFERALQQINSAIMLPYWHWAYDSQAPETSIVFDADHFGGNGQGSNNCVVDGRFANFQVRHPSRGCLQRSFNNGDQISSFYSIEALNAVMQPVDYDAMRRALESAPHGSVHNSIGGTMTTMGSPGDPIFLVHHGFVDKLWADWQRLGEGRDMAYGGRNGDGSAASLNDRLTPHNFRVRDVMDTRSLCYVYAVLNIPDPQDVLPPSTPTRPDSTGNGGATETEVEQQTPGEDQQTQTRPSTTPRPNPPTQNRPPVPNSGSGSGRQPRWSSWRSRRSNDGRPSSWRRLLRRDVSDWNSDEPSHLTDVEAPGADDRTDLVLIRKPKPLPVPWIEMNNFEVAEFREHESRLAEVVRKVNSIDDYVSPCALWLRDDVLARIASKVKTFVAEVRGRRVEYPVDLDKAKVDAKGTVIDIKRTVREQCGGSVRGKSQKYQKLLEDFIGKAVESPKSIVYPYTEPLRHPGHKVAAFLEDKLHD